MKEQPFDQVIDVALLLKEVEVYPEGTREKKLFLNLGEKIQERYNFCIPNHKYLFKLSRNTYPEQYWVEIFAYQFGCLIGVSGINDL